MQNQLPTVTLLVAMRNEAGYIEKCLQSILVQNYPPEKIECWVMDGASSDNSRRSAEGLLQGRSNCHVIDNPGITQAAGWNLGIRSATGDIVGIVSAHCELAPDYVASAVETLQRTGADMVGGPMRAYSDGPIGQAIALATSTPFGVGGARFHYTQVEEEVDTVYMGLCRRELYQSLEFDEEMVRNQDDELSYRLREQGGRIVCNPAIASCYCNRASYAGLWKQYFEYGYWKVRVLQKHPRQMRPRQFAPGALVATLLGAILLSPLSRRARVLALSVVVLYGFANLGASLSASSGQGRKLLTKLPRAFAILHFAYGLGFVWGLIKFGLYPREEDAAGGGATGAGPVQSTGNEPTVDKEPSADAV